MRTLIRKKTKNEPIRSPSPDIANRNIIKNTTIEVQDIRMKFKKAEEKQIKFDLESSLSNIAPSDNASNQVKFRQLYEEYNRLKNQVKSLVEQNKTLNHQNRKFVVQVQKYKMLTPNAGAPVSKSEEDQLFREKYYFLEEQNKRLEQELRELKWEKEKADQSRRKDESLLIQQQSQLFSKIPLSPTSNEQQKKFIFYANSMLTNYETKINDSLNELNSRINKVQLMEKIVKEKQQRLDRQNKMTKTPTSYKTNNNYWAYSTGAKYDASKDYPLSQEGHGQGFPQISSPFKIEESVINQRESDHLKDSEIQRLKSQKQRLSAILQEYQKDRIISIPTPKFSDGEYSAAKKNSSIEQPLKRSKFSCQQCHNLDQRMKEKLTQIQANFVQEKKDLANKIEYQQKIIKHYEQQTSQVIQCTQCRRMEEEIGKLMKNFKQAEKRYDDNLTQLRNSIKAQVVKYERKESDNIQKTKQLNEKYQKMLKMNLELSSDIENYMKMVEYIKSILHVKDINELLSQNTNIYTEMESAYKSVWEEYSKIASNYKYQLEEKDEKIAEWEKRFKLKAAEVDLLNIQLQKIKSLNSELRSNNMKILSPKLPALTQENLDSKYKIFLSNNNTILQKVRANDEKLDILYQKVGFTLSQINNSQSFSKFQPSPNFSSEF